MLIINANHGTMTFRLIEECFTRAVIGAEEPFELRTGVNTWEALRHLLQENANGRFTVGGMVVMYWHQAEIKVDNRIGNGHIHFVCPDPANDVLLINLAPPPQ